MNTIQNRLTKLENGLNNDSEFCGCGTPYFSGFVVGVGFVDEGKKTIINEFCPTCGKPVKPQTVAAFVFGVYKKEMNKEEK